VLPILWDERSTIKPSRGNSQVNADPFMCDYFDAVESTGKVMKMNSL
jgi:hypothetical protein